MERLIFDCAVIGGGPAGSAAAVTLARQGRRIALLYKETTDHYRIGESLPAAAKPALKELGAEALLAHGRHRPAYGNHMIWRDEQAETQDFLRTPLGAGWHLDRTAFDRDLRDLAQQAGARTLTGNVTNVRRDGNGWLVSLRNGGHPIRTRTLIDATGRRAWLARRLGAHRKRDESLIAVHTWLRNRRDDGMTRIEAVPDGWWYCAPLPGGVRAIAFHCDTGAARTLLQSPSAWFQALTQTQHIHDDISGDPLTPLRAAEACGGQTIPAIGEHWVAVGDAAIHFDPIASQGITNALYTGQMGAKGVHSALESDMSALAAYAANLDKLRSSYLVQRTQVYYEVERFKESAFWRKRRVFNADADT